MKNKIKLSILSISSLLLCGCTLSVAGVKIIEPVTEVSQGARQMQHAGLTFVENPKVMVVKNETPLRDSLEDKGIIVQQLKIREKVNVKGIDTTNKYAAIEKDGKTLFVLLSDLSEENEIMTTTVNKTTTKSTTQQSKQPSDEKPSSTTTKQETSTTKEQSTTTTTTVQTTVETKGLGIPYPSAPESIDLFDGITFAILNNVNAQVAIPSKLYSSSVIGAQEIQDLKQGDNVKVLAIGTNGFARIEVSGGKVGFVKANILKKN